MFICWDFWHLTGQVLCQMLEARSIPGSHGFESLYFILDDYECRYNEFMGFDVIKILNHNCW